jgi:hypothetical protein
MMLPIFSLPLRIAVINEHHCPRGLPPAPLPPHRIHRPCEHHCPMNSVFAPWATLLPPVRIASGHLDQDPLASVPLLLRPIVRNPHLFFFTTTIASVLHLSS